MAALGDGGSKQEDQPKNFHYTHLWVSADGETHIKECSMKGFEMKAYAETQQFVMETENPVKVPQVVCACHLV